MIITANKTNNIVLIMGSPRSGTTWLAKLFDSHEDVIYRHEPDIVLRNVRIPPVPDAGEAPALVKMASEYLEHLFNIRSIKSVGSMPMFEKSYRTKSAESVRRFHIKTIKAIEFALDKISVSLRFQIPDFVQKSQPPKPVLVMKSVSSLARTYLFSRALPEAKIIHIVRHPCAVVSSRMRGKKLNLMADDAFLDTQARMSQAKKHGLTLDKLRSLAHEQQMATFWMLQNEKVMEEMSGNPNYKLVVYEDLCNSPEPVCRDLFEFAGLPWSSQTEQFISQSTEHQGGEERYYQLVRNPVQSANKWRDDMSEQQVSAIMDVVADSLPGKIYWGHL